MSLERNIRRQIASGCKRRGWLCVPYPNTGSGLVGFPDLIVIGNGQAAFVEAKQPGKKPTAKQEYWLEKLRRSGAMAFVATCFADVENNLTPES